MQDEIVFAETEPETEWVRGRALQKMSPTFDHSRVQLELGIALSAWALGRGAVGTEWRFRIKVPGDVRRPLVPDVAFVAKARLAGFSRSELQAPPFAPTAAFEILSPGDVAADVAAKLDDYLNGGADVVVIVDPRKRTMRIADRTADRALEPTSIFEHPALPGFSLDLAEMFARALDAPLSFEADT